MNQYTLLEITTMTYYNAKKHTHS